MRNHTETIRRAAAKARASVDRAVYISDDDPRRKTDEYGRHLAAAIGSMETAQKAIQNPDAARGARVAGTAAGRAEDRASAALGEDPTTRGGWFARHWRLRRSRPSGTKTEAVTPEQEAEYQQRLRRAFLMSHPVTTRERIVDDEWRYETTIHEDAIPVLTAYGATPEESRATARRMERKAKRGGGR